VQDCVAQAAEVTEVAEGYGGGTFGRTCPECKLKEAAVRCRVSHLFLEGDSLFELAAIQSE
jgi:hypothetical protein